MTSPACTTAPRPGFTFVELVLVVMVLGIMAGVAAPRYQAAVAGMELQTTAKRLVAHLRYARQEAINRSVSLGIEFDIDAGSYQSLTIDGNSISDPDHPDQPLAVQVQAAGSRVSLGTLSTPILQVVFDMYGDPASPGDVLISSPYASVTVTWDAVGGVSTDL